MPKNMENKLCKIGRTALVEKRILTYKTVLIVFTILTILTIKTVIYVLIPVFLPKKF